VSKRAVMGRICWQITNDNRLALTSKPLREELVGSMIDQKEAVKASRSWSFILRRQPGRARELESRDICSGSR
jgi:hypothetical protein